MRLNGLRWYPAAGKPFDIDFCGAALALFDTLNQTATLVGIQLGQQLDRLFMPAIQVGLYLVEGIIDENAALVVVPAVLGGQSHAVQQEAVQQLGVGGQLLELVAGNQLAGDTLE